MADPFLGEIRIFPFNFPPTGWAFASGQQLPLSQNTALFALLGTFYGGDGKSTFALPDFDGTAPVSQGQSTTGSQYDIGQTAGEPFVDLLLSEIPFHTHVLRGNDNDGNSELPTSSSLARYSQAYQTNPSSNVVQMAFQALPPAGGGQPHNNMMQYLTLNFCIALQGVFPQRP
jgi:microcystin-dependent protein